MPRGGWQDSGKYEKIEVETEISNDIPIPGRIKILAGLPFNTLEVGQSFAVPNEYASKLRSAATRYSEKNNVTLITRTVKNPKTGIQEARCFRVK